MKTTLKFFILNIYIITSLISCKEDSKNTKNPVSPETPSIVPKQINKSINDLNNDFKQNSSTSQSIDKASIEKLYQLSGIPKNDYEARINNPDTLKKLIKQVKKNNRKQTPKRQAPLKGPITEAQIKSKETSTGISIEEAILTLQEELKRGLPLEKRQKVDAISGTTLFSKLNEKEAKYLVRYVNTHENSRLKTLLNKANNLHSKEEAQVYINNIKSLIDDYKLGKIKTSPNHQKRLHHFLKTAESALKKMNIKEKVAQEKFKKLNPDLYFEEEIGETFFNSRVKTAVYLPLGKLSFADKVIKAEHPNLDVANLNNVIGTPDVIKDILTCQGHYSLGKAGTLTVQFINNALTNVNGPDLYIFEIGKIEPTNLEISKDGITWISVGKIDGGVSEVDIAEFVQPDDLFYYVRLTDLELSSGLPGADVDAIAAIGAAMRLNLDSKVLFETGEFELKPEGIEALKKLAESISTLKKGNVIVEGHTDDVGDTNFNKKLSLSRSKSVVVELKKLIPSTQFTWLEKGFGESKPIFKNDSDDNRAKNRRVEILVVPN